MVVRLLALALLATTVACSPFEDPRLTAPEVNTCWAMTPADVENAHTTATEVDCAEPHTAVTYWRGTLPDPDPDYDSAAHARYAYQTCSSQFREWLGIDESTALRTRMSWAWFRPSKSVWGDGERWFHCDLIGAPATEATLPDLPAEPRQVFTGPKKAKPWMTCADGDQVNSARKVPCSQKHSWVAAGTVKLGAAGDEWPGDRVVQVRSRDRCKDWVAGYLKYPWLRHQVAAFEYGFTWYREADWEGGNRRAVCWVRSTA